MSTDLKRFTISITQSMELDLDMVKKEWYDKDSQSEMIRDLIARGLASLKTETEESCDCPENTTQLHKPI